VNVAKSCTITFHVAGCSDALDEPALAAGGTPWLWGGTALPHVTKVKYLGVMFTSDCKWDAHTAYARSKGFVALAMEEHSP
jgi:hypothetical protein